MIDDPVIDTPSSLLLFTLAPSTAPNLRQHWSFESSRLARTGLWVEISNNSSLMLGINTWGYILSSSWGTKGGELNRQQQKQTHYDIDRQPDRQTNVDRKVASSINRVVEQLANQIDNQQDSQKNSRIFGLEKDSKKQ